MGRLSQRLDARRVSAETGFHWEPAAIQPSTAKRRRGISTHTAIYPLRTKNRAQRVDILSISYLALFSY
jgi:hypothetical protein